MSTVGFLTAPLAFDFVRSWAVEFGEIEWARANALLQEMESEGEALLIDSGVHVSEIAHRREVDMRYVGQGHEIAVQLPDGALDYGVSSEIKTRFEAVYQVLYERLGPPVNVEILNWRVVSSGPKPNIELKVTVVDDGARTAVDTQKGSRLAYFPETDGFSETPIYDRYRLKPGMVFNGPAIVEERESTVIIGPDAKCHIDEYFNLIVKMPGA
jgi:N-methylhydantoinase A